jgi:RNA polymerase sigma-70 factor, ECF subfamily
MSSCSGGIQEMTDPAVVPSVRGNKETGVGFLVRDDLGGSANKFYGLARKDRERVTVSEGSRLKDRSFTGTGADADESGPTTLDRKLMALKEVAERRRAQLVCLAQRSTNNREEAEDVVQEAFLKAFKNLAQFRGDSTMGTWLFAIVRNTGHEWRRKQRGRVYLPLEFARDNDDGSLLEDIPDPGRNPEQFCERQEINNIVRSEIDDLNSVCRSAIQMCALEELSYSEAANALGVSVCTIKARIFHGKRMLKRALHTYARDNELKDRLRWSQHFDGTNVKGGSKSVRTR